MSEWSSLHAFHSDPVRYTHKSWLDQYPESLLKASLASSSCKKLLNADLLDMYPVPDPNNFNVPMEFSWALADSRRLRLLAVDTSMYVFSPWIKRLILKSHINLVADATGPDRFEEALNSSAYVEFTGNVFNVADSIHDSAVMRHFFIDVGWACLLQVLQGAHPHLAWRFKLMGRRQCQSNNPQWWVMVAPNDLTPILAELVEYGESI